MALVAEYVADKHQRKFQKELNAGILSLILLAVMDRAEEDMYGYKIAKQLQQGGDQERPLIKQSAIYPVLRSMSASGLLDSRVTPSVSGPPRRYYSITKRGREVLANWRSSWETTRDLVDSVLEGGHKS